MIIKSLEISNYRNYEKEVINFNDSINLLYGNNAQGKTNILEAIYLSATAKSHRGSKDKEIINFNKDEAHIKIIVEKREVLYRIDVHLKKNKTKGIAINGIPVRKSSELFGITNVVFFSPEDLGIIKNSPADRRKFIDMELCQLDKIYLNALLEYNKVLNQRNKLLKELYFHKDWQDTLDIWDIQLAKYGEIIIREREKFIKELNNIIFEIHYKLSNESEKINLFYDKNIESYSFLDSLKKNRENDIRLKTTNIGPHRDDIGFFIKKDNLENEIDLRKFGSQGQQRTAALSLKLSELELVKRKINDYPILLLDDVLSELDANRQEKLLKSIDYIQTIITCTGVEDFLNTQMSIKKLFKVVDGRVYEEILN